MRFFLPAILMLTIQSVTAQITAGFTVSGTQGCTPYIVNFNDNSTGSPTSWFWDFGDGQTSTQQNPTITYTTSGTYTVRLIAKNNSYQDYIEKTNYINVGATPVAGFQIISGDSGCISLLSSFRDTTNLFGATVKSWLWNFGDGSTSSSQNPSHTYTVEGKYNVSLTVQTTQGCSASIMAFSAIAAGNKPVPDFTASPLNGCASTFRNFNNKSGSATAYQWDFGDNSASNDKDPQHHYRDTGLFSVKLVVSKNGCLDSVRKKDYIHVQGAVARFNPDIDCSDKLSVNFRDISVDETSRLWKFGDGSTSTQKAINHVYAAPGIYVVELDVTGTVCDDVIYDTLHLNTGNPKIKILPDKSVYCRNDSLTFILTGYDSAISRSFAWGDGGSYSTEFRKKKDTLNYVYRKNGYYQPVAYFKDIYGCIDTIANKDTLFVDGPKADFISDNSGCINSVINFTDESTGGIKSAIKQWKWSFGDGSIDTNRGPLQYKYSFPVVYNASLKVTDGVGCTDSVIRQVSIADTPVINAGIDTFTCANTTLVLNPTGATTYTWAANPDLSCTNCTNPIATPSQSESFYVTGTNDNGCSSTDSVHVQVQTKELISVLPKSYSICQGDTANLNVSGAYSYSWSPAINIINTNSQSPLAFPTTNTTYTVTGKDSNNCFTDTAFVNVIVNPSPVVNIIDSSIQLLTGSTFTLTTTTSGDATNPTWTPATGLSCYSCLQPVASVSKTITYTVKVSNQYGCIDSDKITINAICTAESVFIPNTFSPNNDGMNDYFFPRSSYNIPIKSLTIFNRWGQLVFVRRDFYTNNYTYGWDGGYKGKLQYPDVYVYILELQCNGSTIIKKGNITLLR